LLAPIGLAVLLLDGRRSRLDGTLLLSGFAVWLAAITLEVRRQRSAASEVLGEAKPARVLMESVFGVALLILAGLIVWGATSISAVWKLKEFAVGATIVAVGTSVPERATAIVSRLRGHDEVGLGAILGNNVFNGCSSSVWLQLLRRSR
jgi:cation:H+ antiporter